MAVSKRHCEILVRDKKKLWPQNKKTQFLFCNLMRRTFTLRKQGLLCICDSKDFKGIWKLFVGSCHSVEKRNMCMYKFIVRRSRSWVICLVWKVEMFLPAEYLARCSWHKSGLCSVYCLIGKVLPHLQKQAIRKLVVINRQFELTQWEQNTFKDLMAF